MSEHDRTPDLVLGADHSRGNAGSGARMAAEQYQREQALHPDDHEGIARAAADALGASHPQLAQLLVGTADYLLTLEQVAIEEGEHDAG